MNKVPARAPAGALAQGKVVIFQGDAIEATIISRNTFGNVFLNIQQKEMHRLCTVGESITVHTGRQELAVPYRRTFGDVPVGKEVILDDDFGRVELAINQGNFAETYNVEQGEAILLKRRHS